MGISIYLTDAIAICLRCKEITILLAWLEDRINLIHVLIDTITSQNHHIAYRFHCAMPMGWIANISIPVHFMLA